MNDKVLCATRGGMATLTLNVPAKHNAFDDTMIASLSHLLHELEHDAAVRAVVLTGAGGSFSSGADLEWMRSMADYSEAENLDDALRLADLLALLDRFAKPTIARVNGPAFGGGVGLIACCDIAVCADTATFRFPEVRLGLVPAVISRFVVAAIGRRNTRALYQTAEIFDAAAAQRLGLVHGVCAAADLDAEVARQFAMVKRGGPLAQRECKSLLADLPWLSEDEARHFTAQIIAELRVSAEGQEGLRAFLDKRLPAWRRGNTED